MLIKIYNAYRLRKDNMRDVIAFVRHYRAAAIMDMEIFLDSIRGKLPADLTLYKLNELIKDNTVKQTGEWFDVESNVIFFWNRGLYYMIFYLPGYMGVTGSDLSFKFLSKFDSFIEDFHYQDQSDKPDSVSDKEWKKRGKIWKEIFADTDVPRKAGFTFNIFNKYDSWRVAKYVLNYSNDL